MNRILSPVWYIVIAIVAIIMTWKIARNSGKHSASETIMKKMSEDLIAAKASIREAVKRDFNDNESLVTELNESEESKEPLK